MDFVKGQHASVDTEFQTLYPITGNNTKVCSSCVKEKSVDCFGKRKNGQYKSTCRKCDAEAMRSWCKKNPDKAGQITQSYYHKNRDYWRLYNRCRGVGITVKEYLELFRTHNGKCDICGVSHLELNKSLGIDHNHETGEIRGLLCDNCNKMLGFSKDNPKILESAISYLKKHEYEKGKTGSPSSFQTALAAVP